MGSLGALCPIYSEMLYTGGKISSGRMVCARFPSGKRRSE